MKRALIVATVGRFFNFEKNDIKLLQELGYEVHCATNLNLELIDNIEIANVINHQIDFARSPFSKQTLVAYNQLKELLKNYDFDLIHCHTPVGGILTRLVAKKYRKNGAKVIYTAHGFHFFKGAPKINWLIFYPLEKFFSRFTDILITINKEDYQIAQKKFNANQVEYVPGVGIDVKKFNRDNFDVADIRRKLGLTKADIIALSVGELSTRKNHEVVIKAISKLPDKYLDNFKYLIVGNGDLEDYLKSLTEQLKISNKVMFLGYRKDIPELCAISDMFLFPSLQEGLPVALMEAMASGLPVICSNIRGTVDLINDETNGYLYNCYDIEGFAQGIEKSIDSLGSKEKMINIKAVKAFDLGNVEKKMKKIYLSIER